MEKAVWGRVRVAFNSGAGDTRNSDWDQGTCLEFSVNGGSRKFPGNKEVVVNVLLFMEVGNALEYETVELWRLRGSNLGGRDK